MNIAEEQLLRHMSEKIDALSDDIKVLKLKYDRQSPFIDELMVAEEERQKLYMEVRSKIIGTGILATLSAAGAIMWFAVVHWIKTL